MEGRIWVRQKYVAKKLIRGASQLRTGQKKEMKQPIPLLSNLWCS